MKSKSKQNVSIDLLRKRIISNAFYLDKEAVEFVVKRLTSTSLDPRILKL